MIVQLLEMLPLEDGAWLTFWNVDKSRQVCLQIVGSRDGYVPGALYEVDSSKSGAPEAIRFVEPAVARAVPSERLAARLVVPSDVSSETRLPGVFVISQESVSRKPSPATI